MRQSLFFAGLLAAVVFISGCLNQGVVSASLDTPFQLKVGQTAFIGSENLNIKFLNVTEDSRCPKGAKCVWRGVAVINIDVFNGEDYLGQFELADYDIYKYNSTAGAGGYSIKLLSLEPGTSISKTPALSDYVATLLVSKK